MDFSYYPGCSLHSIAAEFNDSVQAVFAALDVGLHELEDWNCCGASSAHSLNRALSLALPARNLAIAQEAGRDVVMPCAACFNRHKTADHEMRGREDRRAFVEETVGFQFDGTVGVRPLLDAVGNAIGLERIEARVTRPLTGLKVVSYYGCLLVRPPEVTQFENPENPTLMDRLLALLGADVRPWSYATECCGGGLALTRSDVAARLVNRLVARAREAGAKAIVTSCPLCQMNLEMRQSDGAQMPLFYFTELVGLALGLDEARSWWGKHLIDPTGLLQALGLQ
ncbi:MAG: CoB--CoM heterodisulfide reductase iron-sulfur subunit B family protein [Anaerolineae bacterium]